jgi:hypothetical protein
MTRVGLLPETDLPSGWTAPAPALAFHAVVAVVAVAVLALPSPALGVRVTIIVLAYHLGMLLVGRTAWGRGWGRAWLVLAPLSVLMVAPDWFLSAELATLDFPDTGAPFVGTVPVFMAGMWVMALFPLVLLAGWLEGRFGRRAGLTGAAAGGAFLFWAAERLAPLVPLWEPRDVPTVGGVAAYVLPAEVMLSAATWLIVRGSLWRTRTVTVIGVAALPVAYSGALVLGWQLIG